VRYDALTPQSLVDPGLVLVSPSIDLGPVVPWRRWCILTWLDFVSRNQLEPNP
jgi:hypothetical protein